MRQPKTVGPPGRAPVVDCWAPWQGPSRGATATVVDMATSGPPTHIPKKSRKASTTADEPPSRAYMDAFRHVRTAYGDNWRHIGRVEQMELVQLCLENKGGWEPVARPFRRPLAATALPPPRTSPSEFAARRQLALVAARTAASSSVTTLDAIDVDTEASGDVWVKLVRAADHLVHDRLSDAAARHGEEAVKGALWALAKRVDELPLNPTEAQICDRVDRLMAADVSDVNTGRSNWVEVETPSGTRLPKWRNVETGAESSSPPDFYRAAPPPVSTASCAGESAPPVQMPAEEEEEGVALPPMPAPAVADGPKQFTRKQRAREKKRQLKAAAAAALA